MLNYISKESLQNIPKMLGDPVIYVEGNFDKKLYSEYFNNIFIVSNDPNWGAKNKIIHLAQNNDNIIGIVDADFDKLENTCCNCPRVFYTDLCDAETMVLFSPSVLIAVNELFKIDKGYFENILDEYKVITAIRILDKRYNLGISFKKFTTLLKSKGENFDKSLPIALNSASEEQLKQYCTECQRILSKNNFKQLKICRWHDIENKIISKIYKVNNRGAKISFEYIILSRYKNFFETDLYKEVCAFLRDNNISNLIKTEEETASTPSQ